MLCELPVDIWQEIVLNLSVRDVCNLRATSRMLGQKLAHELIWRVLYQTYYETIVNGYGLDTSSRAGYYDEVMAIERKRRQIEAEIDTYNCLASKDPQEQFCIFRTIVKKHTLDERNIVPLLMLHEHSARPAWDIQATSSLQKQALVTNLIIGCSFGMGLRRFLQHVNQSQTTEIVHFERFMNDMCLFDRSFHLLVGSREKKLGQIHRQLYTKFVTQIDELRLPGTTMGYSELTPPQISLSFEDELQLQVFLNRMVETILDNFHVDCSDLDPYDRVRYLNDSFLEDYSLPRVYACVNKAPSDIMGYLVGKMVKEFAADKRFVVASKPNFPAKLRVEIRKGQLMMGPFVFIVRGSVDDLSKDYTFHSYKVSEYVHSLRNYASNRRLDVMQYLTPTNLEQLIHMTLGLKLYGTYNSVSMLSSFKGRSRWFPIRYSEYNFNTSVCQMFLSARRGYQSSVDFDKPNLQAELSNFQNYIFVPVIMDISNPRHGYKCFHNLHEEIKWQTNYSEYTRDQYHSLPRNTTIKNISLALDLIAQKFEVGQLVVDTRSNSKGVIIGFRKTFLLQARDFCVVYSIKREIEVYNCDDVVLIPSRNAMDDFLREAGNDELALQFFSHIEDKYPTRLVPNCFFKLQDFATLQQ